MTQRQRLDLILEMRIRRQESLADVFYEVKQQRMYFYHCKNGNINRYDTSIYAEFEVLSLYGMDPSEYDQERFRNFMADIFGDEYRTELKKYLKGKAAKAKTSPKGE